MSVNRFIREGRRRLGLTEQQFAVAVGVSRAAVQQWERCGGTAPKRRNQARVAQLLGVSIAELMSGGSEIAVGSDTRIAVALISEVEAGNYTVIDNFKPNGKYETVPVTVAVKRHTYALRVHGDSMVGESGDSFPDGSLLIVEPEMKPMPGDYVIAMTDANETTFKQLVKDAGELYLRPLNARYPIKLLGTATVIGVVREFSKRFR